jgi:hypothetical protein
LPANDLLDLFDDVVSPCAQEYCVELDFRGGRNDVAELLELVAPRHVDRTITVSRDIDYSRIPGEIQCVQGCSADTGRRA